MTRALLFTCVALALCAGLVARPGVAWAGKQKIAILGLEAAPGPTGAVDPATTQAAKDITRELRQRAQSGASPYMIAPNSNKELTDEKLLMSCDNEKPECMAVIGAGLAADVLLYGRVEKRPDGYRVALRLLDVKAKTIETATDEVGAGAAVPVVAKRMYVKLIGEGPGGNGSIAIRARTAAGAELNGARVLVDEEAKGEISGGKLTLSGIPEGRHTIAIESGGLRRYEEIIMVHGGEQARVDARLVDKLTTGPAPSGRSSIWKYTFAASLVVAAAGGGLAAYAHFSRIPHYQDNINAVGERGPTSDDCSFKGNEPGLKAKLNLSTLNMASFDQACTWHTRRYIGLAVAGAGVIGAATSLVFGLTGSDEQPRPAGVAIAPVVTADGAGATLSLTW